tara:strand:- start:399 stop:575 length:177 start_codon:yes stop_codon:yes gene_type:complete
MNHDAGQWRRAEYNARRRLQQREYLQLRLQSVMLNALHLSGSAARLHAALALLLETDT